MAVNVPGHKGFINVQKEKQQENIQEAHHMQNLSQNEKTQGQKTACSNQN